MRLCFTYQLQVIPGDRASREPREDESRLEHMTHNSTRDIRDYPAAAENSFECSERMESLYAR